MGKKKRNPEPDANRDPLSNEPGAHPVGVGVGATGGAATGAAMEDDYWRQNYKTRPYVKVGRPYETYRPAYQEGWEARGRYGEHNWEKVEPRLREEWTSRRGDTEMSWEEASPAARDAFRRLRPSEDYRSENR